MPKTSKPRGKLRVFTGCLIFNGVQVHACVGAHSVAECARIIQATTGDAWAELSYIRDYWSHDSHNDEQMALCLPKPGALYITENTNYPEVWRPYAEGLKHVRRR